MRHHIEDEVARLRRAQAGEEREHGSQAGALPLAGWRRAPRPRASCTVESAALSERIVDLVDEGFDLAIRVGTPGDYRPFAIKTDAGYSGHDIDVIDTLRCYMNIAADQPTIHYRGRELDAIDVIVPRIALAVIEDAPGSYVKAR